MDQIVTDTKTEEVLHASAQPPVDFYQDVDDVLTENQCQEEYYNELERVTLTDTEKMGDVDNRQQWAPVKRRCDNVNDIPEENKKKIKRKLFQEDTQSMFNSETNNDREAEINELKIRPTLHRFVYGDEILDLRCPLPGYEGASIMLTNVYNTFVHIVQYKSTLLSLNNRKLAIQLRAAEHYLRQLEKTKYKDAHIYLPRMVESLFSMLDHRNNPVYINHMKPISCILNKRFLMDNISFRSMEATSKNDSNYIELMFNNPFRFIFVGCAKRGGQHNKNVVTPFPFFGEYINKAINDMFEVMYELVSKEIRKAKKELAEFDQLEEEAKKVEQNSGSDTILKPTTVLNNSLQMIEVFSNSKSTRSSTDQSRLHNFLRAINMPLAKKEAVDILVTSGNSGKKTTDATKMCYLTVENDKENQGKGCLKMIDTDVTEDSVYMSSYIRCRVLILEQAVFRVQIYTRDAIKLLTIDDRLVKFSDFSAGEN